MSIFRSETMGYYNIEIPRESAWEVLNKLGYDDSIHFVDSEPGLPSTAREFSKQVKRCDETLVKIGLLKTEMNNFNKDIIQCEDANLLL